MGSEHDNNEPSNTPSSEGSEADFDPYLSLVYIVYDDNGALRAEEDLSQHYSRLFKDSGSASLHDLLKKYLGGMIVRFKSTEDMDTYDKKDSRAVCAALLQALQTPMPIATGWSA